MTEQEREALYDAEIAPALLNLGKLCRENGLSLLAVVEWAPGEFGRTLNLSPPSGLGIRLTDAAARANGNVDSLMIAIMRYAREHGHSSAVLHQLGVPMQPETADEAR